MNTSYNNAFFVFDRDQPLTQQYGFIKFDEEELDKTSRLSQFFRLAMDTDPETVVRFIQEGWNLPTPDLIISVTGGAKQASLSPSLRKTFQRGLVAAATNTSKTKQRVDRSDK